MSPTQNILRTFVFCSIGGISLLGCPGPIQQDGSYCFNIDEGETCPDMDTINETRLPYEPECSTIEYIEATSSPEQNDSPISGMDYIPDEEKDSCCYTATYRTIRSQPECVMGRPLMEEGSVKVAFIKRDINNPWIHALTKPLERHNITQQQCEIAGKFYLTTALYEHASIASFQKFGLDLMRFGAPPHLLDKAQQATRDEILHARMSFSIAASLLQENVQPSTLDYTPTLCENITEFARHTLIEGAIGETFAVLLASEQLRVATDPAVREFLHHVVKDEAEHAELAWETLRWCLQKEPSIRNILLEVIQDGAQIGVSHYPQHEILAIGLPSQQNMKKLIQTGFDRVIIPSILSLLDAV